MVDYWGVGLAAAEFKWLGGLVGAMAAQLQCQHVSQEDPRRDQLEVPQGHQP